jgi:hypothetical protein
MSARGYRAMFATDRVMPQHYSKLHSFWREVIGGACQTVVGQASHDDAGKPSCVEPTWAIHPCPNTASMPPPRHSTLKPAPHPTRSCGTSVNGFTQKEMEAGNGRFVGFDGAACAGRRRAREGRCEGKLSLRGQVQWRGARARPHSGTGRAAAQVEGVFGRPRAPRRRHARRRWRWREAGQCFEGSTGAFAGARRGGPAGRGSAGARPARAQRGAGKCRSG